MKQYLISLSIVCCLLSVVFAGQEVILQKTRDGYVYNFEVPGYDLVSVDTYGLPAGDRTEYYKIQSADLFTNYLEVLGRPNFPVLSFFMAVAGPNDIPTFEVLNKTEDVVVLSNHIFPTQKPWPKNQPKEEREFDMDYNYYNSSGLRGPVAQVSESFEVRGVYCVRVDIIPFTYNPLEKKFTIIKKMALKIKTGLNGKYVDMDSKDMGNYLKYLLVNYDDAVKPVSQDRGNDTYLIITPAKFEMALAEFVTFRSKRFSVKMVNTGTAGTTATAIETYIRGLSPKPTYVLLVGDVGDIPGKSSGCLTDNYYGCPATGYTADKFVGRMSVSSETDLKNVIAKTISHETNMPTYPKKAIFIGGTDAGSGSIAEGTHNYCINTYLTKDGFTCTKLYTNSDGSASKAKWTAASNEGAIWNIYSGHGSTSSWAVGPWSVTGSDFAGLTNTQHFFAAGFACYTGEFGGTCVSETSMRATKGAVTHIGSVVTSDWGGDDDLQRGMFDGVYATSNPTTTIGASFFAGKKKCTKGYNEQYNLFGDPAASIIPVQTGPFLSVTSPNGGEKWEQGTTQKILWGDNINGKVKIELLKGGTVATVLSASAESNGSFDWVIGSTVQFGTDYKVRITSVDSAALTDESNATFSVTEEFIVKTFPYVKNYDDLDSGSIILPENWAQVTQGDDFDWLVWKGPTPSKQYNTTGPNTDHSGTGKYMYVEASSPNNPSKKADFTTPKFNFKSLSKPQLSFWCHMFSDSNSMGTLTLDICVDGTWKNDVLVLKDDHGDNWFNQKVDLTSYKGDRVIFRFRAVTGKNYASDMCIDDYTVENAEGTSISVIANQIPNAFDLKYFGSRIIYQVPENKAGAIPVSIKLYNQQGRLVQTLMNGTSKAGYYSVGMDKLSKLGCGMYYCTLKSKNFVKTTNVLLVK